jgi:hypothetical protein
MEHKGNHMQSEDAWYIERPDFFNSVAFWYQTDEPKSFGHLPPWPERCVPWRSQQLVRDFLHARTTDDSRLSVQTRGFFGGRPMIIWSHSSKDARLMFPLEVAEAGRYVIRLTAIGTPQSSRFDIELDGKVILDGANFVTSAAEDLDVSLGTHTLEPGQHELVFRALNNPFEGGEGLVLEMLRLLRLPPEAVRHVKTHNEAHFIRLGIGRAVYAYRLAHGRLPETLEALVESGIMSERFLRDENGYSLVSQIEGEYFAAKSTAPDCWSHRWQGLDARR